MDNIHSQPNQPSKPQELAPMAGAQATAETPAAAPFSNYQEINQVPYGAKYFNIDYNETKTADIDDLIPQLEMIESYVKDAVLREEYFDSTQSYDQIVGKIIEELGIQSNETARSQIIKIYSYLNNGKAISPQFRVKRSTLADQLAHAQSKETGQLRGSYSPRSFSIVDSFLNPHGKRHN